MSFKQNLFNVSTKIMEEKREEILAKTIRQAEVDGYNVTFSGDYKQATSVEGSVEMPVPFVVAQTPEQIERLDDGVLEGRIYDIGRFAAMEGTISDESIEFEKRYDINSAPKKKFLVKILSILLEPNPKRCGLNPNPIRYFGHSLGDNGNYVYEGNWSFEITDKDLEKPGDLEKEGTFKIKKI